jgi:hypothetical protein
MMEEGNIGYRLGFKELEALTGDTNSSTMELFKIIEILYDSRFWLKTSAIEEKLEGIYGNRFESLKGRGLENKIEEKFELELKEKLEELEGLSIDKNTLESRRKSLTEELNEKWDKKIKENTRRRLQERLTLLESKKFVTRRVSGAGYEYKIAEEHDIGSTKYNKQDLSILEQWKAVLDNYEYIPIINDLKKILNRDLRKEGKSTQEFSIIDLPKINYAGTEFIQDFYDAIAETTKIDFVYQRFNKSKNKVIDFMPYLLKEHNKRWYVVGKRTIRGTFYIYALDRIKFAAYDFEKELFEREEFDAHSCFSNSMGIFMSWNKSGLKYGPKEKESTDPIKISFKVRDGDKFDNISYLMTNKIHDTQKESKPDEDGWVKIKLKMFPEADLIRKIRGMGVHNLKDLKPTFLNKWAEEL